MLCRITNNIDTLTYFWQYYNSLKLKPSRRWRDKCKRLLDEAVKANNVEMVKYLAPYFVDGRTYCLDIDSSIYIALDTQNYSIYEYLCEESNTPSIFSI